jgi:serine/threonine protein kinase
MKVFRRLSLPERAQDLLREFEFLSTCSHPGLMRVYDRGVYRDQHPFYIAEYLPETLAEAMTRGLAVIEKIAFAMQLVSAIHFLANHAPPVVHRDIKPDNIFVKGRQSVLGDFGLMKELMDGFGAESDSFGTKVPLRHRTPDLIDYELGRAPLTPQSDVFQMGLVLAELFAVENPQREPTVDDRLSAPIQMRPLRQIPGRYGGLIASILMKMLQLDPEVRPTPTILLDSWQGVFENVAKAAHAMEGRVL